MTAEPVRVERLVERWEWLAEHVDLGWYWEEWVNELDGRRAIADALEHEPAGTFTRTRVDAADRRFREQVEVTETCGWGDEIAIEHGWTRERNWWYWTAPRAGFA